MARRSPARPLRVLHVIDGLEVGGAQSVVLALIRLANASGVDPYIANVGDRLHPGLLSEMERASSGMLVRSARAIWDVRALAALARAIPSRGIDVVHTHLAGADVVGGLAARLTGRPVVSTLHSVADWRQTYPARRRVLVDWANRTLATRLIAVSEPVRSSFADALGIPPERFEVIPNVPLAPALLPSSFDRARKRAELGVAATFCIATASRLSAERDHETLIRAAALLDGVDATILLAGDGERRSQLEALVGELALGERVRFLGTRLDAVEIVAAADVFCQPTFVEGLPVAVLDAMSLSVPVVASRVAGVEAVARDGETALLVRPGDAEALALALRSLADDAELRHRLAAHALEERRREPEVRAWADEVAGVYRRVLAER